VGQRPGTKAVQKKREKKSQDDQGGNGNESKTEKTLVEGGPCLVTAHNKLQKLPRALGPEKKGAQDEKAKTGWVEEETRQRFGRGGFRPRNTGEKTWGQIAGPEKVAARP